MFGDIQSSRPSELKLRTAASTAFSPNMSSGIKWDLDLDDFLSAWCLQTYKLGDPLTEGAL